MSFTLDQLDILVRSRYSFLYLLSHEERRVERRITEIASEVDLEVWRWRATSGLIRPDGDVVEGTSAPMAALRHLVGVAAPAVFVLFDFHTALGDSLVVRQMRDLEPVLAARSQALVIVAPVLCFPPELEKDLTLVDVPLPNADEVGAMLDQVAAQEGFFMDPDARDQLIRAGLGLTEGELRRALSRIILMGGNFSEDEDVSRLIDEKRRAIRKSQYLEFYDRTHHMNHVGGMDALKVWLDQRARAFSEDARKFGLPAPRGLFLLGVQGCGKSLMAKAVADLWRVPLLRLDVGAVFQVQERAEQSLRETIRIAESLAPVVLWIDELEKGFLATRDEGGGRALGTFLTWMQEKTCPVFVVATANDVRRLPPELLRKGRFDEIFFVDLPDVHERLAILEIHIQTRGRNTENFDLTHLAEETEKFSGAELEQVVIAGLFQAFAASRNLQDDDLFQSSRDMVPLAVTMDDHLKTLREWARPRARAASLDTRRIDYFEDWDEP